MRALAAGAALTLLALVVAAAAAPDRGTGAAEAQAGRDPPRVLADGTRPPALPRTLRRFDGLPVVGARRLLTPIVLSWCTNALPKGGRVGWLSPDGLSIVYSDPRSSLPRACDAVRVRGRWLRCSVGVARSRDPRRVERAGGALGVCTRGGRWRAFMWVARARGAAWGLVRRRGFWVAYPLRGVTSVRISGTERGPRADRFRTTVVFLDRRGRVVERRRVVGAVAG